MAGFCKHCGRELEGNEPYCPECGSPTGIYQSQPAYAPRRGGNSVAIAIVVLIVAFSILAIALIPMFLDTGTTEKYTVTVKIESVSVNVSDPSVYGMFVFTDLSMNYSYGSSSVSHDFGMWVQCPIDGTKKTDLPRSTAKFVVTGNPLDVKYTAFLKIKKDIVPWRITRISTTSPARSHPFPPIPSTTVAPESRSRWTPTTAP